MELKLRLLKSRANEGGKKASKKKQQQRKIYRRAQLCCVFSKDRGHRVLHFAPGNTNHKLIKIQFNLTLMYIFDTMIKLLTPLLFYSPWKLPY